MALALRNPFFRGITAKNPVTATLDNDRYFRVAQNAKNWRWAFFGLLWAVLGLVGALVYVISREQVRVFVERVDDFGNVSTHELTAQSPLAPDVLELVLGKWVRDIRTLTTDHEANVARMTEAYAMATSTVQSQIADYYHENTPEELLKKGARFPEHVRVAYAGGRTWNLKWEEKIKSEGRVVGVEPWEAVLEVEVVMPRNAEERRRSKLGVWVTTLHWAPAE